MVNLFTYRMKDPNPIYFRYLHDMVQRAMQDDRIHAIDLGPPVSSVGGGGGNGHGSKVALLKRYGFQAMDYENWSTYYHGEFFF